MRTGHPGSSKGAGQGSPLSYGAEYGTAVVGVPVVKVVNRHLDLRIRVFRLLELRDSAI